MKKRMVRWNLLLRTHSGVTISQELVMQAFLNENV